jgi:hypothetical protein
MKATFIIVFVLFCCSCNKSKLNNTPVSADLKATFNYKVGTYWIYKDSLSGDIDSFFVTNNGASSYINSGGGYSIDEIGIAISQFSYSTSNIHYWHLIYQSDFIGLDYVENTQKELYIDHDPLINYPFDTSIHSCSGCSDYGTDTAGGIALFNTYNFNGTNYMNVALITCMGRVLDAVSSQTVTTYNDDIYLCPAAGIIKMRLNHKEDSLKSVLEIQRYKIVK